MDTPFPAYKGTDAYAFACYAHKDSKQVFEDLSLLAQRGVRVWYDEGIQAGASWRAEIADAIGGASTFIFFISDASLKSAHCLREVDFAISHDIRIIPVYLDGSVLPGELELVLNRVQALFRHSDSRYESHLIEAIQGRASVDPPALVAVPRPGPRRSLRLALIVLAPVVVLLVLAWWPREPVPDSERPVAARTEGPTAYDRYLEGQERVERWDRDDNLEVAIRAFQEAVALDPGFALAHARLADALRMRHALNLDDASLAAAAASAREAMRLDAGLAPVQVAEGRVLLAQNKSDLAVVALERAIAIDPNDATAHQAIATCYDRLGRTADAESSFRKAIALDPESIPVLDSWANFLFRQSRFEEAVSQWSTITRIAPDNFAALVNLGSALGQTGKVAESIDVYQRAIALRPTYMAYSNLGTAYSRAQRYDEAAQAYRKALELEDSDWLAWGNLAQVYSWMGGKDAQARDTFARAIALAEEARRKNTRDAFVHSDLALYYAKSGQRELSLRRLDTALALAPDSGEIKAAAGETWELLGERDNAVDLTQQALGMGFPRQQLMRNPELAGLMTDPRMQGAR